MIVNLAVISHTISSSSNVTTLSSSTQHGLVAIGSLAALSIVTTGILLLILTFRFVFNVRYHVQQASSTMHHVLIYNLVLAQLLQSLNFVIALRWSVLDVVVASSGWCSTQAGLLQVGDVAAGAFALVIAVQSLWSTVKAQKSNRGCLVAAVVGIWVVAVVLSVCARAGRRRDFFVPNAGSWCEIAREYGPDRLWRYYFWLFVDVVCFQGIGLIDRCPAYSPLTVWHHCHLLWSGSLPHLQEQVSGHSCVLPLRSPQFSSARSRSDNASLPAHLRRLVTSPHHHPAHLDHQHQHHALHDISFRRSCLCFLQRLAYRPRLCTQPSQSHRLFLPYQKQERQI